MIKLRALKLRRTPAMENNEKMPSEHPINVEFSSLKLSVGEYIVDFNDGLLIKPDLSIVSISKKPLKVLEVLILHRKRFLSGSELHRISSGRTETLEAATRQHVKKLRQLFEDNDKSIFVTESRGYKLSLSVKTFESDNSIPGFLSKSRTISSSIFQRIIISILLFIIVSLFSGMWITSSNDIEPNDNAQFDLSNTPYRSLTYLDGIEFYPVASTDGRWVIFNHLKKDSTNWRIYLRDMKSETLVPLTDGRFNDKYPKWSIDGKYITFTRLKDGACMFMNSRLDIETKQLKNMSVMKSCNPSSLGAQSMLWKDNKGIFYVEEESYSSPAVVYSYAFDSKASWQVTSPSPTSKGDYFIQLSHSGEELAVLRSKNDLATEIWLYNTRTWENRLLDTINYPLFRVNWSASDTSLVYKNSENQIIKTDLKDNSKQVIADIKLPFYLPILHGEFQNRLAMIVGEPFRSQIFKMNFAKEENELFVSSAFKEKLPTVSTDGQFLAWVSSRGGLPQLWLRKKQEPAVRLTKLERYTDFSSLTFSPDGLSIGGTADGHYFIYNLADKELHWSQNQNSHLVNFEWRANSSEFFVTEHKKGHRSIFLVNTSSGKKSLFKQVPEASIIKESLDGRFLYSWNQQSKLISRYDIQAKTTQVLDLKSDHVSTNHWSMSEKGLFISTQHNQYNKLVYIDHFSIHPEVIDESFESRAISLPANANWLVFNQGSIGNTELVAL